MRVVHFVQQCTVMFACAVSVSLGWPFTQHKAALKARKHELRRGPSYIDEVISSRHSSSQNGKKEDKNGNYPHSHQRIDKSFIKKTAVPNSLLDTEQDEDFVQKSSQKRYSFPVTSDRITFQKASPYPYNFQNPEPIRFGSGTRDTFFVPGSNTHGSKNVRNSSATSILKEGKHKKRENCQLENGTKLIPCRSNRSQCLHDNMICNGKKDCDGGEDEDAGSCLLRNWVMKRLNEIEDVIHKDKAGN